MLSHTVETLRKAGVQVKVTHVRHTTAGEPQVFMSKHEVPPGTVTGKGGATYVNLRFSNGLQAEGKAKCHDKDSFCRKSGLTRALGRALAEAQKKLPVLEAETLFGATRVLRKRSLTQALAE